MTALREQLPPTPLLVRYCLTAGAVLAVEVYLYTRYAAFGAQFHFWLHGMFGVMLGIALLTLWRLLVPRRRARTGWWETGFVGHVFAALPDVLFLNAGILHTYWMDVFALHITLHFVPHPLLTSWALMTVSMIGYALVRSGHRRAALGSLGLLVIGTAAAVATASPVPHQTSQLQAEMARLPGWMCPGMAFVGPDGTCCCGAGCH